MTSEQKGLRLAAAITILTGLALAAAAFPPTNGPIRLLTDLLVWPFNGAETLTGSETRLGLAIGGGVMAGWGALIWMLAGEPFAQAPDAMRRIVLTSTLIWFVVDSLASVLAGASLNVVANLAFLALFLLPLRSGARQGAMAA